MLDQTYPVTEILVVTDGPATMASRLPRVAEPCVRVVENATPYRGAGATRQAGIDAARGGLIALLDDDDWWEPNKLQVQIAELSALRAEYAHAVVGCRVAEHDEHGQFLGVVPRRLLAPGQSVGAYLFEHPDIRPGATGLRSSMLLFDRELALLTPFNPAMSIHEDWDWVIRVYARGDTALSLPKEVLLNYTRQSVGESLSSSASPWQSLGWLNLHSPVMTRRQRANFCLLVTAPHALRVKDGRAFVVSLASALAIGRGSPRAWLFLFGYLALSLGKWLPQAANPSRRAKTHGASTSMELDEAARLAPGSRPRQD